MITIDEINYEVGYKKPPKDKQFKKGKSGNPTGRSKKGKVSMSISDVLNEEAQASVTIRSNGKTKKTTMMNLAVRQLVTNAAKGHLPSARTFFKALEKFPAPSAKDNGQLERLIKVMQMTPAAPGEINDDSDDIDEED